MIYKDNLKQKSVGKSGSFAFASALGLWVAAKANVPHVWLPKN